MHRLSGTALVAAFAVITLSSAVSVTPAGARGGRGLVIGSLAPETGDLSPIVDSLRTPVQIAVDQVNAAGGVLGQEVTLVTADEGSDLRLAGQALDRLVISDEADAVIGPGSDAIALGILDRIRADDVLVCSGSTSSATLTRDGPKTSGGRYFRTIPPDDLQGAALGQLVLADGHGNVGIIARDDAYGLPVTRALVEELKQGGAEITVKVAYDPGAASFDTDVQQLVDAEPSAVIIVGLRDDGVRTIQTMISKDIGPHDLAIYASDRIGAPGLGSTVDPANPGVVAGLQGTAPAATPAGITSPFQHDFAATGQDPIFSAYQYDCAMLVALAAVKAGSTKTKAMAKALTANTRGENPCNSFAKCADLLGESKTIRWSGASSTFDDFGKYQPRSGTYDVWRYDTAGEVATLDASRQITIR